METTARYATRIENDKGGAIARIAIYARLSRDPGGLSVNTSIQVVECLEEAGRYVQDRAMRVKVVVIFEENDIGAIERIEVFPGIGKPFVKVDGITMRFDKDRVKIIWRQPDSVSIPAA